MTGMQDSILKFEEAPTKLAICHQSLAAIIGGELACIFPERSYVDTLAITPCSIDFVSDEALAYSTTTGAIGILDYRCGSHEMFVPRNSQYRMYDIRTFGSQLWTASDDNGICLAVFDLRNLSQPVIISDIISSKIIAIHRTMIGNTIVVTTDGQFYQYNKDGRLISRKMINTDKVLLANAYEADSDYFVSVYPEETSIHGMNAAYRTFRDTHFRANQLFFCGSKTMALLGDSCISVRDLEYQEIFNVKCGDGVAAPYNKGFLRCDDRELFYNCVMQ